MVVTDRSIPVRYKTCNKILIRIFIVIIIIIIILKNIINL